MSLEHGQLPRLLWQFATAFETGVLTVDGSGRSVPLVLRRGKLITPEADALGRRASRLLDGLCLIRRPQVRFADGVAAYPPGASARQFCLASWVRRHFEAQLTHQGALALAAELGDRQLSIAGTLVATAADATDRRIIATMAVPRRLVDITALSRAPRFRLLSFIYFLHGIGALSKSPATTRAANSHGTLARRLLGVRHGDDPTTIKRAYRRLVRTLHPDLHPRASAADKRRLENRLVAVNRAYRTLTDS